MDWKTKLMIGVGALVLVFPAAFLLTRADAAFRQQCNAKCSPTGQSYRVVNTGYISSLQYPAECFCIPLAKRTLWEKLRDSVW